MQGTNQKYLRSGEFLNLKIIFIRHVRNEPRLSSTVSSFLGLALLIICSFGCAPSSSPEGKQNSSVSEANNLPQLTEEIIRERINETRVWEVPEESGTGDPIVWNFEENEPKEITVVEKQLEGARATVILDIKTQSAPNMRNPRYLEGQIRTDWELKTGWVLRKWEIVRTENISMKYKNLPKTPPVGNQQSR